MKARNFLTGLSGKLLILTILFVMLAELILFIPSAAMYRQDWLGQRAQAAQQLTLAIMSVENYQSSAALTGRFMRDTDVTAIMQRRDGMTEQVLGMAPANAHYVIADYRAPRKLPDFGSMFSGYFSPAVKTANGKAMDCYLRVLVTPSVPSATSLEIIIPRQAEKDALMEYLRRVIGLSTLIALLTGTLIYMALSWLIVRPLQRLERALSNFREDPERRAGTIVASNRRDEIGALEREFIDLKTGIRGALKQKDRLAALGLAVAKINHDLRNVLTSAQLISDRLATDSEERVRYMGQRLVRAIDRGVKLCAATLNYSKSSEDAPRPINMHAASLIGEAAGEVMTGFNGALWINDIAKDAFLHADPDHVYRIFSNLFRNALQAMGQAMAGHEHAGADTLRVHSEIINNEAGKAFAHIYVSDSGPGLSARAQDSLFKPFTGDSKTGTGLGLTLSRELARAHGGDLRLESSSENGAVFVVELPMGEV
ncbi:MAG: HAMP domain-containing sensor histidine kinase [Robiginitomaculum sp.]